MFIKKNTNLGINKILYVHVYIYINIIIYIINKLKNIERL